MSGVIINVIAVLAGTFIGLLFGGIIPDRMRSTAFTGIGLATTVIGAMMAIDGIADLTGSSMGGYAPLVLVGSLVLGALAGEAIGIEAALERAGHWMQERAGRLPVPAVSKRNPHQRSSGHTLVDGFITASLLFCVGAMAVLGSIQSGLGDPSTLHLKAMLDGFASIALASTLGPGVGLSVLPLFIYQGGIALTASSLEPLMTVAVIDAIRATGGALILAIGFDIMGIRRLPVGNLLPAIFVAAVFGWFLG
ncbi:MAG: DUF554 domain-containing protein [Syntrophales bacterium]|jgi:uncharacterized membrane protein YqgA involved in biofilm formation|nr:DUF554 domain-containing protein [Syntrophales bacterium]MCK9528514.1 DUF554 domain-containing protein [Syntrophales bacterium]MDX9922860.1 DUF554 domain-containing protein [Syntrophales bacterium]